MAPRWLPDPKIVTLTARKPGGGTDQITPSDAYAQWVFGRGKPFLPSAGIKKAAPDDFLLPVFQTGLTGLRRPGRGTANKTRLVTLLPVRESAVAHGARVSLPPHQTIPGLDPDKLVITAVIDDGTNIFNRRFTPDGGPSRIDYAWVQEAPAQPGSTVPYGREITSDQITAALATGASETDLMVEFGLIPAPNGPYSPSTLTQTASHGTHMADLAAGRDPDDPQGATHRMIVVQLPAMAVADTSGASLVAAIQSAADYVFDRALAMSKAYGVPIPVALNMSFGLSGGPRDGRTYLEQSLRAQSERYRDDVKKALGRPVTSARMLPAGNRALDSLHAAGRLDNGELDVSMRIQPDDQSPTFLEIWLRENTRNAEIDFTLPGGHVAGLRLNMGALPRPAAWVLAEPDGSGGVNNATVSARLTVDTPLLGRDAPGYDDLHYRVVVGFFPSQHMVPDHARTVPGGWGLSVKATDPRGGPTSRPHAWILRDNRVLPGAGALRQAYFEDPAAIDTAWDEYTDIAVADARTANGTRKSTVARDGSLSGLLGNAPLIARGGAVSSRPSRDTRLDTVGVGAFRWDSGAAAPYTGADLNKDEEPGRTVQAPVVMAVSDTSRVLPGVIASATRSGGAVALNGTSAACAVATRAMAEAMQSLPPSDYARFVPTRAAEAMGIAPPRPGPGNPELVSNRNIREERLASDGTLMPVPIDLRGAVRRGVRRKA